MRFREQCVLFFATCLKRCADSIGMLCLAAKDRLPGKKLSGKHMLINRSDRLGDAFFSLPLLFCLAKSYELTVISSEYNDEALRPFFRTIPAKKKVRHPFQLFLSPDFFKSIFSIISLKLKKRESGGFEYDIYFDMYGDLEMLSYGIEKCRYSIGPAKPFCLFYDVAVAKFHGNGRNMLDNYMELLEKAGIDAVLDESSFVAVVGALDKLSAGEKTPRIDASRYVLVNVGCKAYRNLPLKAWVEILRQTVAHAREKGLKVVVMDDREMNLMKGLQQELAGNGIIFMGTPLSLWQLYGLAKGAVLYVGMDSGPSHLLALPTNALMVFTIGDNRAWRPYSREWSGARYGSDVLETGKWCGFVKAVVYKDAKRPLLDLGFFEPSCNPLASSVAEGIRATLFRVA